MAMTTVDALAPPVWLHDLQPFLVRFGPSFGIRWYGLAYLSGFIVGALFMIFLAKRGRGTINPARVVDFVTYVVVGTMVGGRLGYLIFYGHDLLVEFSADFPYWGALRVWEGGMSSHGGIIGVILASVIYARQHRMQWLHLGDLVTLGGSIGIFFGRLANFVNGELFGREVPATTHGFPWYAVQFPNEMYLWLRHDLGQNLGQNLESNGALSSLQLPKMTAALRALGTDDSTLLQSALAHLHDPAAGSAAQAQIQALIEKIIHAVQDGNAAVKMALATELAPRYPSQLLEAGLEGLFLFAVSFWFWRKPRKPGVVGGLWLTLYALVRVVGEQFRMPDAHIGYQWLGLTRGQWLSVAMFLASVLLLFYALRSKTAPIGGWGTAARALRRRSPLPYQGEARTPSD